MTRIEIGITHEVMINGDKSWIRLSIADDYDLGNVDPGARLDEAVTDLSKKVNEKVIAVIEQTVKTVEEYQ